MRKNEIEYYLISWEFKINWIFEENLIESVAYSQGLIVL